MLRGHGVHQSLSPSCGRACERAQLSRLQVLEPSYNQAGLYDAAAVDDLPLQDPARVDDVRRVILAHAFERAEVQQ